MKAKVTSILIAFVMVMTCFSGAAFGFTGHAYSDGFKNIRVDKDRYTVYLDWDTLNLSLGQGYMLDYEREPGYMTLYKASTIDGTYKEYDDCSFNFDEEDIMSCDSAEIYGLPNGKTYYFKVEMTMYITGPGGSLEEYTVTSKPIKVTTMKLRTISTPGRVTDLKVSYTKSHKAKLSWSKTSHAKEYDIYRASSKDGTFKYVGTTGRTYYTDTGLKCNKSYYYKIKAVNYADGAKEARSKYSNKVKARTGSAYGIPYYYDTDKKFANFGYKYNIHNEYKYYTGVKNGYLNVCYVYYDVDKKLASDYVRYLKNKGFLTYTAESYYGYLRYRMYDKSNTHAITVYYEDHTIEINTTKYCGN